MQFLHFLLVASYILTPMVMLFFYLVHIFDIPKLGKANIESDIPMPALVIIAWVFSPISICILIYNTKIDWSK
jgi:hypothetical protein